jgi:hypothetical protein
VLLHGALLGENLWEDLVGVRARAGG